MLLNQPHRGSAHARLVLRNIVVGVWLLLLVVVCARVLLQKNKPARPTTVPYVGVDWEDKQGQWARNSGYPTYYLAGKHWREHANLYRSRDDLPVGSRERSHEGPMGGFRYSPIAAFFFVPLTYVSIPTGEVIWRIALLGISLGGLYACCRRGIPRPLARRDWTWIFLLVFFPFGACLNNAQSSCLVIGCLLGAIAAVDARRWLLAAILVAIPTLLKLYPVSVGLLLCVMYPRQFSWRFVIVLGVGLGLPFLLRPSTMLLEHRRWLAQLFLDAGQRQGLEHWDQDVRLPLMRWLGINLRDRQFMILQGLAALVIAALCVAGRWANWPQRVLLARMLSMAGIWMTAFGMATEPSTYILIGPGLAWGLWEAWLRPTASHRRRRFTVDGAAARWVLTAAYALLLSTYILFWFPWGKRANTFGPAPLSALLLLGVLITFTLRDLLPEPNLPSRRHDAPAAK